MDVKKNQVTKRGGKMTFYDNVLKCVTFECVACKPMLCEYFEKCSCLHILSFLLLIQWHKAGTVFIAAYCKNNSEILKMSCCFFKIQNKQPYFTNKEQLKKRILNLTVLEAAQMGFS